MKEYIIAILHVLVIPQGFYLYLNRISMQVLELYECLYFVTVKITCSFKSLQIFAFPQCKQKKCSYAKVYSFMCRKSLGSFHINIKIEKEVTNKFQVF